jgi:hypothetical protein
MIPFFNDFQHLPAEAHAVAGQGNVWGIDVVITQMLQQFDGEIFYSMFCYFCQHFNYLAIKITCIFS